MRNYFAPETSKEYAHPEYIDNLIKTKVYKDTPFVIYKDSIGKHWSAMLLCEDGKHFYNMFGSRTKGELIKRIESGSIYNDLLKDYEELGKLIKLIDIYEKRNKDIA